VPDYEGSGLNQPAHLDAARNHNDDSASGTQRITLGESQSRLLPAQRSIGASPEIQLKGGQRGRGEIYHSLPRCPRTFRPLQRKTAAKRPCKSIGNATSGARPCGVLPNAPFFGNERQEFCPMDLWPERTAQKQHRAEARGAPAEFRGGNAPPGGPRPAHFSTAPRPIPDENLAAAIRPQDRPRRSESNPSWSGRFSPQIALQ